MAMQTQHVFSLFVSPGIALVSVVGRQHARTYLAMEKVLSQALANATDTTVIAVIDVLVGIRVIVPQLAHIAVIPCPSAAAQSTLFCGRLGAATEHAEHVLCLSPVQHVVFYSVMAKSARVPATASRTL